MNTLLSAAKNENTLEHVRVVLDRLLRDGVPADRIVLLRSDAAWASFDPSLLRGSLAEAIAAVPDGVIAAADGRTGRAQIVAEVARLPDAQLAAVVRHALEDRNGRLPDPESMRAGNDAAPTPPSSSTMRPAVPSSTSAPSKSEQPTTPARVDATSTRPTPPVGAVAPAQRLLRVGNDPAARDAEPLPRCGG